MATAQQHIPAIPTRQRVRLPALSTSATCNTRNALRQRAASTREHPGAFTSHEATHRRHSEDHVDDADSNGGVDGLSDASPSKDGRGVIKDLGGDKNTHKHQMKYSQMRAGATVSPLLRTRISMHRFLAILC